MSHGNHCMTVPFSGSVLVITSAILSNIACALLYRVPLINALVYILNTSPAPVGISGAVMFLTNTSSPPIKLTDILTALYFNTVSLNVLFLRRLSGIA